MASRRFLSLLAAFALCLVPAACGDDDSSDSDSASSGSSEAATLQFTTTEQGKNKVTIEAPKTIEAGAVEVTLRNDGKGPHDAQLIRVDGNRSADDVIGATVDTEDGAPIPAWVHGGGGLGTVKPGQIATVTEVLEPGTYYVVDSETSGGEGEGKPNARKGGVAKLTVTGEASGELPATDATISAKEYGFEVTGDFKAGKNTFTFENTGEELHHVLAFPIVKGKTIADAKKLFASQSEPKGPPPVDFEGGVSTSVLDGGEEQIADFDLKKGKYALICFINNRKGGPPHVAMGMIAELDVK
jgi:hypothetical protein